VVTLKFAEVQLQILRLRKPQKARLSSLWMTVQLLNELQTQDTGDENKDVVRRGRPDGALAVSWPG